MNIPRFVYFLMAALLLVSGCQPVAAGADAVAPVQSEQTAPMPEPLATLPGTMDGTMPQPPEITPPSQAETPVTGEAPPDLMAALISDLGQRTGAKAEQVTVIRAQAVVWNDGSLGCPQPGMVYTQALVRGYWVVLAFEGKTFDYHAAENGYFVLCENGQPPMGVPSLPDS